MLSLHSFDLLYSCRPDVDLSRIVELLRIYDTILQPSKHLSLYNSLLFDPPYSLRYDTIRDAILTCARKPTWIGLIYRTEPTTKNCKTEKLKSKSRYVRSNSKNLGNHVVRSEKKRKRKAAVGRLCRKRFQVWNGRESGWWKIIITNKCNY